MSNRVVVLGAGFGDEGKGVVTEYLCSKDPKNTIVVRFSGGQQAGHKVIKGDIEHIFSSFGSGTLSGCSTYWSKYCTFSPRHLSREFNKLKSKGLNPRIAIHPDCPVTTSYDMLAGQRSVEREHGTTGQGIFRTKKRHYTDGLTFTAEEVLFIPPKELDKKLDKIRRYYGERRYYEEEFLNAVFDVRLMLKSNLSITDVPLTYFNTIFEGSQGLMLDEHIGHMPHCTPSDLTPRNILKMGYDLDEVFLVTRAYQTRHGSGPMTNEEHPVELINIEKETNVHNAYQGAFRTSVLDLDQLMHAKRQGIDKIVPRDTKVSLVVTCIDQMSTYKISCNGQILAFDDAKEFTGFIGNSLDINSGLYTNASPYSQLQSL